MTAPGRLNVALVCAGRYHDFDYARLQLLTELQKWPTVRTDVFVDYGFLTGRPHWDLVVTYTCDLRATVEEQRAARDYVVAGGRWVALHGSNAVLDPPASFPGQWRTPDTMPVLFDLLGSRFVAHPPVHPYLVERVDDHPFAAGIEPFTVSDELYCSEIRGPIEIVLATEFTGESPNFAEQAPTAARRPVLYFKRTGDGSVCYFTLGHCRGLVDTPELELVEPAIQRGAWEQAEFRDILRRCLAWGLGTAAQDTHPGSR